MEDKRPLRERIKGSPIHSRLLDLKTYPLDGDKIIVEGYLRDERFLPVYDMEGHVRREGLVHHMVVRLLVGGKPLTILDAEAEMPHVPHERCPNTLESIKRIIGLEIKSGFGEKVHQMMGGKEGCAHLTHLVITMGQEAVHGFWTNRNRNPRPIPRSLEEVEGLSFIMDSCSLWREDGPLFRRLKALVNNQGS